MTNQCASEGLVDADEPEMEACRTFDLLETLGYAPPALDGFAVRGCIRAGGREPDVDTMTQGLGR